VRRANEFNGWDVCLRNSFLGVKSWFMVKEEREGGRHEDFAPGHHSNFIIGSNNYARQLDSLRTLRRRASHLFALLFPLLLSTKVPVIQKPDALDGLRGCVCRVAGKQQVISGLHSPRYRKSHPVRRVKGMHEKDAHRNA